MDTMFRALQGLIKDPLRPNGGVKTDNSILLIYPPDKELDFREYLLDTFVPAIEAQRIAFRLLDLTGFLFAEMNDETVASLQEDEFDDFRWMQQGLSKRAEAALHARLEEVARQVPGGNVIVYATVALFPLVRYGEILRGLRDVEARIILAFPGEERAGKLHFKRKPNSSSKSSWPLLRTRPRSLAGTRPSGSSLRTRPAASSSSRSCRGTTTWL